MAILANVEHGHVVGVGLSHIQFSSDIICMRLIYILVKDHIFMSRPCSLCEWAFIALYSSSTQPQPAILQSPGGEPPFDNQVDCYTVLTCWQSDCQWGMRHGLQLAGITLLWLAGLYIVWYCHSCNGLQAHMAGGNFHHFSETTDNPLTQP